MSAWMVCQLYSFRSHWNRHSNSWLAAEALLASDVCTDASLRIKVREFNRCTEAEEAVSIGPFQSALFSLGEDIHICGHKRCEIMYLDITSRLAHIAIILMCVTLMMWWVCMRNYTEKRIQQETQYWSLPAKRIHLTN